MMKRKSGRSCRSQNFLDHVFYQREETLEGPTLLCCEKCREPFVRDVRDTFKRCLDCRRFIKSFDKKLPTKYLFLKESGRVSFFGGPRQEDETPWDQNNLRVWEDSEGMEEWESP